MPTSTTRRQVITGGTLALGSLAIRPPAAQAQTDDGIRRASRKRFIRSRCLRPADNASTLR